MDILVGNLQKNHVWYILCPIMQQSFRHIYTCNLKTLFYCWYFEIETSVPFVQTEISGKQANCKLLVQEEAKMAV